MISLKQLKVDSTVASGDVIYYDGAKWSNSDKINIGSASVDFSVPIKLPSFTVLTVPDATKSAGQMIYVSNESGGAVPAYSDGTNWRRVTDRNVVS
jgi:hypothetical protein